MTDAKNAATSPGMDRRNFLRAGAAATAAGALISPSTNAQGSAAAQGAKVKGPILAGDASYAAKLSAGKGVPSNVPQRPGPPISIDVHAHWAPEVYLKAKADLGRPDFLSPNNHNLAARAKWMDEHGEKMQVLTLGGFMPWQWVTPEQGAHIAQITNDASIEAHAAFPERFLFGIELPVGYAAGSLAELNRVAGKPGLVAVHVPNSLAGREYLFEPEFAPVLARIEELRIPLLIHPLDGEPNWYSGHRLDDAYSGNPPGQPESLFPGLTNSAGETFEQATTVCKLIVSGTMDKYPNLDVIICHGGGAFPYIVGRLDRGGGAGRLKYPVHSYIRRFYFDDLTWYPLTLKYLIDLVGSDRVVVGTDNMGPGNNDRPDAPPPAGPVPGPHSVIDQLDLTAEDRDLILRGNLKRLFKLA
jgi:aminocarboxymuconate-semialdehyde decarboxylase